MLLNWLAFFGCLSLLVSTSALPIPTLYGSNAQRLARGLPPLPPVFKRVLPGYSHIAEARNRPTRVYNGRRAAAPSPSPSPSVSKSFSGKLEVRDETDKSLGFIARPSTTDQIGGLNTGGGEDVLVQFTVPSSSATPFAITATNSGLHPKVFIGAAGAGDIDVDLSSSIELSNIEKGPQSSIWSFNRRTKELTAQIINSDGSKPPTHIAYSSDTNKVFFTGDIDAFNAENSETSASIVNIFLHP